MAYKKLTSGPFTSFIALGLSVSCFVASSKLPSLTGDWRLTLHRVEEPSGAGCLSMDPDHIVQRDPFGFGTLVYQVVQVGKEVLVKNRLTGESFEGTVNNSGFSIRLKSRRSGSHAICDSDFSLVVDKIETDGAGTSRALARTSLRFECAGLATCEFHWEGNAVREETN